jgi:zinc protease
MRIAKPQSFAVGDSLLARRPLQGEITGESVDEESGAVLWELSNGANVILKKTANRNDEIVLQALARGGTSSASAEDDISATLAVEMVQVSGLGPWSRPELSRMLAGKQVSLASTFSNYTRGFRGSSTSGDLETFFEMLYLSFTDPRIDNDAVAAMMSQYATALALRNENPSTAFSDAIIRTISSNHPRFRPMELDDLARADTDVALDFIRKGLNPADYTFVFTGNLDLETMRQYVETYLASIPPLEENWNTWVDLGVVRPGRVEEVIRRGKEEKSQVYMAWFFDAPFSEEGSSAAQALTEYLNIVLIEEIREKLGGVYSISSSVSLSPTPRGEFSMQIVFACDPKRTDELATAVMNLLQRTTQNINRDTFAKAVEALLRSWEVSMQSNAYIAQSYANSSVLLKQPLARLHRRPQYFNAVTPADIQNLCAQLLQNGPAQVKLFPGE